MKTLKGFFLLVRPFNVLICGLSVVCGSIICGKPFNRIIDLISFFFQPEGHLHSWEAVTCSAAFSASLVLAAGNALNDVCDLKCDIINSPRRPIPSGMVTPFSAAAFALFLAFLGLMLSLPLGIPGITVAVCAVLLLAAYDLKLKSIPVAGNLVVAVLGGLAFVYGGLAGGSVTRALLPVVFALMFHFGREILKDAADISGDVKAGLHTAATVWGKETACSLAAAILMALAVITVSPFTFGFFGIGYFLVIALGVWPVLLYASVSSVRDSSEKNLRRISGILKIDMPVGILAILAGFQGY